MGQNRGALELSCPKFKGKLLCKHLALEGDKATLEIFPKQAYELNFLSITHLSKNLKVVVEPSGDCFFTIN